MRVLFVAFDGVLHPASAAVRFAPTPHLKPAVQNAWLFRWAWILDELLAPDPTIRVITHSNWRLIADDDELRSLLGPLAPRFIGSTPRLARWPSIAEVIESNRLRDFRILDAWPAAFPAELNELIACDPESGVRDHHVHARLAAWVAHRHQENA